MAATSISCTACGANVPEGAAFCPECGAHQPPAVACASCGAAMQPGAHFCPSCGASTASLPPPPPPTTCASCGRELVAGAHFCASCGTSVPGAVPAAAAAPVSAAAWPVEEAPRTVPPPPVPPPAPVVPAANVCASCGTLLKPGARFCGKCGSATVAQAPAAAAPMAAPAAAPPRAHDPFASGSRAPAPARMQAPRVQAPRAPAARPGAAAGKGLTWRDLVLGGGLVVAFFSVFFDWISAGSAGAGPMDENARFRIGDWLSLDKGDGYAVMALAAAGVVALVLIRLGRGGGSWAPLLANLPMGAGSLLAVIALLEYQYITTKSEWEDFGVDVAFGVYVLLAGGIAAAIARFVPDKPIGQAGA